ncbi:SRPBCC family protein [Streptomyces sp. NK15101]|uniref:SRPBCC family protein n=1 Tax=Streptomyces sp. NK15101 TaxID=2873261 RepID=UPI001CEC1093|nr:SRPBCC family protein [Streptomyces sp. NK15101]
MGDSALGRLKGELADHPATDRLKEELHAYLRARAERTVTRFGERLGEGVAKLAEPGAGTGGAVESLAKGGQALREGRSPAQAAVTAGVSHLKDTVKDKVKGLFGKGRKSGGGKARSVTIVEDIDVGVPVREAYDQWTQFQEFSTFAKGVVSVEKADDTTSNWKVKVAKSTRSWQANVTEQVPDERIMWTTEGAKGTVKGVVTFHPLTDDLTRVLLVLEYFPKGLFEKTGNIWRAQGRRARLDLKLYRKFIMMRGEATDGWRGEIRDGEVVVGHDEAIEEEREAAEEQEETGAEDGLEDDFEDDFEDADDPDDPDESGESGDADEDAADEYETGDDAAAEYEEPEGEEPDDEEPDDEEPEGDEPDDEEPEGDEPDDEEPDDEYIDESEAEEDDELPDEPDEEPGPARRSRRRTAASAR